MKKVLFALVATLVAVSVSGCAGLGKGKAPPSPPIVTKGWPELLILLLRVWAFVGAPAWCPPTMPVAHLKRRLCRAWRREFAIKHSLTIKADASW